MLMLSEMPLAFDADVAEAMAGWVLVEGRLGRQLPYATVPLLVRRRGETGAATEIPLPVRVSGELEELVCLPGDVAALSWRPPDAEREAGVRLTVRRVGWIERVARMNMRVFWVASVLPWRERAIAGLTFARSWRDPVGAYRDAATYSMLFSAERYPDWIARFDALSERDRKAIAAHIRRLPVRPRFRVLVIAGAGAAEDALAATQASLQEQIYGEYLCETLDAEAPRDQARLNALNAALAGQGEQDWLMIVHAGDVLAPHALYWFACEALERPETTIVYSDDDRIDGQGRRTAPRFKPDWSPGHFRSADYIGAAAVVRSGAAARAGGVSSDCCRYGNYDLLLRTLDACGESVRHLPALLLHRSDAADGKAHLEQWRLQSLQAHYRRRAVAATVTIASQGLRTRYSLPESSPRVSIIVPTRDAPELLRRCVESVLRMTGYPDYELLVVDNQSVDPAALAYLAELGRRPGVRVLRYPRRFNYAAINNYAAGEASGAALCLLNNDTEVISGDWLEEMVGHLMQQGVGVVGAKLLYPGGKVQHGGVAVGPGGCHHLHVGLARDDPGYCGRAMLAHECSAVTGACLLTWKSLYRDLGGLNAWLLPVTFNDTDYCLRMLDAGRRVLYTPHAVLNHHESATRGIDSGNFRKELRAYLEMEYLRARWGARMTRDPYYNPNLSYRRPDFSLGETMRVRRPWTS